ncbi:TetR/AcrR family transcriptional regulator [Saccharomonospora saliphila]|uniref:TetR/AcrR family transcriptional regulator n=1 Tax=Saccharomonospora saliphila TaxID=369829 RepID=UPI00036A88C4|nr:TetR/AcrR family transcriptional regulator [Saccharomonospora saliphila]
MAVDTRAVLRTAAEELFAERGFHGTGIRDLARACGLSTASLYHHMGSKEDLLAEIMRDCLRDLRDSARAVTRGVADPRERVRLLVRMHVEAHALRPRRTRIVDHEIHALTPLTRREVVALRDEYERVWAEAVSDGVDAGVFTTAHPGITRIALLEMCTGVAHWYSPDGDLPLDELARHHADLALRVLGACSPRSAERRSKGE